MDSAILSPDQESSLLLGDKTFKLLWRGSRDGFKAEDFHQLSQPNGERGRKGGNLILGG